MTNPWNNDETKYLYRMRQVPWIAYAAVVGGKIFGTGAVVVGLLNLL